jgi:small subunit ribosomal protein S1
MVHINDIDWNVPGEEAIKKYNKGDAVSARVLDIDIEKERISLGIKQLSQDPTETIDLRKNSIVTTTVVEVTTGGIEVSIADGAMKSFIRKTDLSRDRAEQRPERFAVGDKVDALVISFDKAGRKVSLSIKAMEIKDEKEAVEQYGSADSGASLGDILGAALKGAKTDE